MLRLLLALATLVLACSAEPIPTPPPATPFFADTILLPGWTPLPVEPGILDVCGGVGRDAILRGDPSDPRVTWLQEVSTGWRIDIIWPAGTAARFAPRLEVISPLGDV